MWKNIPKNKWERFFGITLNINPIFNIIGIVILSIKKRDRFKKIKGDRINLYFWGALVLSGIVSVIISYNKSLAIVSFFLPFFFIWLYILGRWYIDNPVRLLKDMVISTSIMGFFSIVFYVFQIEVVINGLDLISEFHKGGRGYILGIGDNGLGVLFQAGIVGALGLLLMAKNRKELLYNLLYFLLSTGGLMISNSRGAMVGTASGVLLLGLIFSWKVILLFIVTTVLSILYSPRLLNSDRFVNRVKSIFDLERHQERIEIWKGTINLIKDHFWFGTGPSNFSEIYEKYRLPGDELNAKSPHSNYLNIISGWGIIGGIIFYGWILMVMIRCWLKGMNKYQKVILAVLIAFWVHVLINDLFAVYVGVLLGCLDNDQIKNN